MELKGRKGGRERKRGEEKKGEAREVYMPSNSLLFFLFFFYLNLLQKGALPTHSIIYCVHLDEEIGQRFDIMVLYKILGYHDCDFSCMI